MGVVKETYFDKLISEVPDRNSNRIRVYKMPNEETVIHFRNLKIVLHSPQQINEWVSGFETALNNLGDHFKNDI